MGDGHDKLDPNWLAVELASVVEDIANWSPGLRESYESLFGPLDLDARALNKEQTS
ncbi:hypothetical protein GCM10007276_12510 [Agaricicola taiwanensis]|uniref:Uncharacterized protein n=1 Tax=Agaricicola taiwanensis TaxID=591372 RepID=A0A8J2VLL2_9RHOB|nr:hypothetical protein [Agaricicola taiwanensis]GGE36516.1 hypothetical protein GCM10007276_12510 [Agaricicola taiwanensis]